MAHGRPAHADKSNQNRLNAICAHARCVTTWQSVSFVNIVCVVCAVCTLVWPNH